MLLRKVNIEKLTWWTLAMNVVVIIQGAVVRATGSGAGCGRHWPLCNGEVVPLNHTTESLIEFSHRSLSLVVLLLGLWLLLRAWGLAKENPGFRWFATASFILVIVEALLGAATVLFGLTGDNVSTARGLMVASHLVNSMLLIGALSGTVVYSRPQRPQWPIDFKAQPALVSASLLGLFLMLVIMFSGGIAAMGNTMFPVETLAEGIAMDFDSASNPLIRLRVLHPVIAIGVGVYLFLVLGFTRLRKPVAEARRVSTWLLAVYVSQMVVGFVNLAMLAPVVLQLLHLMMAVAAFALFMAVVLTTLGYPLDRRATAGKPLGEPLETLQK